MWHAKFEEKNSSGSQQTITFCKGRMTYKSITLNAEYIFQSNFLIVFYIMPFSQKCHMIICQLYQAPLPFRIMLRYFILLGRTQETFTLNFVCIFGHPEWWMKHSIVKCLHVLTNQSIPLVNGKVECDFYLVPLKSTIPVKGMYDKEQKIVRRKVIGKRWVCPSSYQSNARRDSNKNEMKAGDFNVTALPFSMCLSW